MDEYNKQVEEKVQQILSRPVILPLWLKLLIGALAGLSCGGMLYLIPLAGQLLSFTVVFPVLLALTVYGAGDLLGYAAFALATVICGYLGGGVMHSMVYLLAVIIPTAIMIRIELSGKMRFYDRMFVSLGIELLALVSALALLRYVNGTEIAQQMGQMMNRSFALLSEADRELLSGYYAKVLSALGYEISAESPARILEDSVQVMTEFIKLTLPAVLVVLATVNVFPGCLLCSYIRKKRNLPNASYEPVIAWRMPAHYVGGLALLTAAGVAASLMTNSGGVVLTTVLTACSLALFIQYLASITDRLSRSPMGKGMRVFLFIADTLLLFQILPLYGLLSMLFGSKGVISGYIRRRRSENN